MIASLTAPRPMTGIAQRAAEQGWLKWAILFSASFGAILEVIDTSIINVALPDMQGNLGRRYRKSGGSRPLMQLPMSSSFR